MKMKPCRVGLGVHQRLHVPGGLHHGLPLVPVDGRELKLVSFNLYELFVNEGELCIVGFGVLVVVANLVVNTAVVCGSMGKVFLVLGSAVVFSPYNVFCLSWLAGEYLLSEILISKF